MSVSLSRRLLPIQALLTLPSALVVAALCVLVALTLVTQTMLRNAYRDDVRATLTDAERSAQRLAVRAREVIDQVDQTTLLVKALHETRNPMNLTALREASLDASEVTRAVVVTDRDGHVIDRSSDDVPMELARELEFAHHAKTRDPRVRLGLPTPTERGDGWIIPALRRIDGSSGQFDGVVAAFIDPAALTRGFYAGEAHGTSLGLIGEDNVYRALLLAGRFSVGDEVDRRELFEAARATVDALEPRISSLDGRQRFVTIAPVDRYPLYAVVTVTADEAVANYRKTREQLIAGAAAIALAVVLATLALCHQARKLDQSRRRAHRAESMYRATSEGSLDAVFMLSALRDAQGRIVDFVFADANGRGLRLLRQSASELIGMALSARLPRLCESGYLPRCRAVVESRLGFEIEFQLVDSGAAGEWLHHQVVPLEDGIAIISRDITERKTAEHRLDAMARHDALTQLPNRRYFEEHLDQAAARARRSGKPLTLVYLDLDGFKRVNDNFGHASGDQLLIEVARRLKSCVRTTDHVSRLGGDEFTVILEESGTPEDRLAQCERLLTSLSRPHLLGGVSVVATPSLGVAVYQPGEPLAHLRNRADAAMYEAKRAGKACLRWAPAAPAEARPA